MEIRNNATLSNAAATATSPQQIASLKLDAILDVVVQARMGENRFQLQRLPGGEPLTAMSQSELTVGQRLQVQVSRLGALPELRVVPAEPPRPEVVPKALRELLPKQIDLKELATMVGRLPSSNPSNLPGPVHLAVERLAAALPQAEKLMTPEGLQKAVRNSGIFLEASLAAALTEGAPLPENDLKARLLNLLAVLQPGEGGKAAAPAQALQQENALSPPGTVPSQTAAQASEEAGDQASLNPDKVPQRTDSALPKTIGESLLPSQSKGAAEGQFPAAPPAPSLATQSGEKVSVPVPAAAEQSAAKLAADKAANSVDLLKPEKEGLVVGAKPQPFETSLSTARSAPTLPSAGKAEDSFSKPEEIDPAKLAQKAEGALAKIAVDQLASQPRDDGTVCLQLNLPFVAGNHQDNAELSITAEGGSLAEDRVPAWTATIQVQPPCMGAFNARIIWNGTQIDACLWSDREETADRIGQTTETLRAKLEQAGLAVGALTVLDRPPSSPLAETVDLHLLDLLA
jgi:hypothetical protein